jgi:MFS family permease
MDPKDAELQGTVVAIYSVGCFTGCLIMAFIGKMLGRRMFIVIGGLLILLGAGLQTGSHGVGYLIGGRVIAGIGMGEQTIK